MTRYRPASVCIVVTRREDRLHARTITTVLKDFGVTVQIAVVTGDSWRHSFPRALSRADASGAVFIAFAHPASLPTQLASRVSGPVLAVPGIQPPSADRWRHLQKTSEALEGGPVGCVALGPAGLTNSALLAVSILALDTPRLRRALTRFRRQQTQAVMKENTLAHGSSH